MSDNEKEQLWSREDIKKAEIALNDLSGLMDELEHAERMGDVLRVDEIKQLISSKTLDLTIPGPSSEEPL